jgi:opacity protein-like surface antigen
MLMTFFALALLVPVSPARAQAGTEPKPFAPSANAAEPGRFQQGDWVLTAFGSTTVFDEKHGRISTGHLGAHYYFKDQLSLGLDAFAGYVQPELDISGGGEPDDNGIVGGVDLMLRWHFLTRRELSLYLDGGVGFQQADTNFPADSHHNFRNQFGLGATYRLGDNWHLMGGVRYLHVSNASTSDGNNGGDWAQPYLGVMLDF